MEQVLLVIHVVIAAALIGAVLLQRSETDGFGLGSGSGANFMTGRASASLMTRTTAILAALFIANSLILSILASQHKGNSILDTIAAEDNAPVAVEVEKDKETKAIAPALNRDKVTDTDQAAKKATAEKAPAKAADEAPAADEATEEPAVPTAE